MLVLGAWSFEMDWFLLNSGPGEAAFNMALDETLLEAASRLGKPVLRYYGWTEPAATFGYFQKYADVERATLLRPLIRRPTGGGIVPHDADWTYSFVVPPGHEWHLLKAEESYRRIHEWIQAAFAISKLETELAPVARKLPAMIRSSRGEGDSSQSEKSQSFLTSAATGQCFAGHEKFDLLWRGRKIAGAAQRRNKLGLLIQGSVQPPLKTITRTDWENAVIEAARERFQVNWCEFSLDQTLRGRAAELTRQKYSQSDYNQRR